MPRKAHPALSIDIVDFSGHWSAEPILKPQFQIDARRMPCASWSAPTRRFETPGPGLATTHRCKARHDRNDSYQKTDRLAACWWRRTRMGRPPLYRCARRPAQAHELNRTPAVLAACACRSGGSVRAAITIRASRGSNHRMRQSGFCRADFYGRTMRVRQSRKHTT